MYETFLVPSETAPTSLSIKRALLTFDRVIIPDPEDRDYFPSQSFWSALSGGFGVAFPMGGGEGPVRPLGKLPSFDADFDRAINEIEYARREGIIDIVSTYDISVGKEITFGAILDGGFPLNSTFLLWSYRNIARYNNILEISLKNDSLLKNADAEIIHLLGGDYAAADGSINDDPALPLLTGPLNRPELRESYTKIARARIASTMKSIGFCASKQMVPTFSNFHMQAIAESISYRAASVIDSVSEMDPEFYLRNRVLNLSHNEYLNEEVLERMTIDDVLKLRTRAWGQQAEARDELLKSAAALAAECASAEDFDREVRSEILNYRRLWDNVAEERRHLSFSINCDLVAAAAKAIGAGLGGEIIGNFAQLQNGVGAATLLFAGCLLSIEKIKEYGPILGQIKLAEAEFSDHACFGIQNFYDRF